MYFYYWFMLSYIPYPTAWDANHAYMFFPKMWALNNWYYWNEISMSHRPYVWYGYITYFFSLFTPISNWRISPDTLATVSNFFSWIFVLIFWMWLIRETIDLINDNLSWNNQKYNTFLKEIVFYIWRFLLLLWLTSWMGAFLVFVDNKTDLWVLSLVVLAIYSWIVFIRNIKFEENKKNWFNRTMLKYTIISWLLFALATMAKPTAFLDFANFWIFLSVIWIWFLLWIWILLLLFGLLIITQFRWINEYFIKWAGWLETSILWWILSLSWLWYNILRKLKKTLFYIKYILILVLSFCLMLILFRWSFILYSANLRWDDINTSNFLKQLFLSQNTNIKKEIPKSNLKLAFNSSDEVSSINGNISKEYCSLDSMPSSSEWLYNNLRKSEWSKYQEDNLRYVWYQWKPWRKSSGNYSFLSNKLNDTKAPELPSFQNPRWWVFFPVWNTDIKCYWVNENAKLLCEKEKDLLEFNIPELYSFYMEIEDKDSKVYELLSNIFNTLWINENNYKTFFADKNRLPEVSNDAIELVNYMKDNAIKVQNVCIINEQLFSTEEYENKIEGKCLAYHSSELWKWDIIRQKDFYIPYKYLTLFNITYNRSLQNLSSYYTDIGFVWLILIIFLIVWLFYGLISKNKNLIWLSVATIFGWIIWFFIWWWILWYGIWLIIWTILSFVAYLYFVLDNDRKINETFSNIFIIIIFLFFLLQILLNFSRISTQWWAWPFIYYKQSIWFDEDLIFENSTIQSLKDNKFLNSFSDSIISDYYASTTLFNQIRTSYYNGNMNANMSKISNLFMKSPYKSDDVFKLHFPHYTETIEISNNRWENDWLLIAWTYIRYFIKDQSKIKADQFLTWLWEQFSDGNLCKSYLRLKDNNIKYLVIDPNIATVVMWWWNETLLNRFYAKFNKVNWELEEDWVLTMLSKLYEMWYISYVSSNNIWAKYWLDIPKEELETSLWRSFTDDELVLFRSKLIMWRFNINIIMWNLIRIIEYRLSNGDFLFDLADILWKEVDKNRLWEVLRLLKEWSQQADIMIYQLTANEKNVLLQYSSILSLYQTDKVAFNNTVQSLITRSLTSWSQIITLKVND